MVDLAGTLVDVMERNGWTDADVASAAGIASGDTVRRWRDGRTNLTERKLSKVLVALGENPKAYGLPPAPEPPVPLWARRLEQKMDALIAFHRSGGDTYKLDMVVDDPRGKI